MLCKVLLGSRLAEAGRDDFACGDVEACDEALGSVPYVLELDTLDEPGFMGFDGYRRSRAYIPVFSSVQTT